MEIKEALALIYKSVSPVLEENGFEPVYPLGVRKSEIPIEEQADKLLISFQGGKGAVRIAYKGERMVLLCTDINASEATDEDYKQASLSLFDPSTADDKDIRYIGNEFSDTVRQKFGKKDRGTAKTKLPTPVSKSAAKSGALAYDPNTLASRFTTMYPELREMYKANIEKYGDFLAEEFFREYGTPAAMQTIRQNDKQRMDGKTDYINCSVQYPNWWYLRRVKDNNPIFSDWAILFIDPIVATIETTQFCKVNAATRYGAYICKGAEAFRELFSANVGRQNRTKDMLQNAPTDDQAEVLVYENIPVSMIKGIAFENEEIARQKIVEWKVMGFPKIDVFISPELFDVSTSGKIRRGEEPLVKPYREEENELF